MKRCLTSLIMRQMQIETTVRCHITPVKCLSSKTSTNKKSWRECIEKGKLLLCWWEYKLIQPLWRTVWMFLKKLWTKLSYYQQIPWLGLYPKKTIIQKDTCTLLFIVVLFTIARTWWQPIWPLSDEWRKKLCAYIQWKIIQPWKRMKLGHLVMWKNLDSVIQSETSQEEENKYHILIHICGI